MFIIGFLKTNYYHPNHDFGSLAFVLFFLSLLISECVEISQMRN